MSDDGQVTADLRTIIDQAFTDAGPIYDSDGPKATILTAVERALDQRFLSDQDFGRRLELLMRRNPRLLENWIRQRERIHGRRWY